MILDEIEMARDGATIFSLNRLKDAVDADPEKYPALGGIFSMHPKMARATLSKTMRAEGFVRWNAGSRTKRTVSVWRVADLC
ncbi:MAG: hypothetical protein WC262_10190 [Bacteroidales bacterium]|jgi:hypothetical protein